MAGGERKDRARRTCASAFAVGDAGNGARGIFAFKRRCAQMRRIGVLAIVAVEVRNCTGEQAILRGEARILVFGRFFRHVDSAGNQTGQNIGVHVGR